MSTDWIFPPTLGGEESGLNDPGIEFFRNSGSLAREIVQNSLDAAADPQKPVRVAFSLLQVPVSDIPGADRLREVLARCRKYQLEPCKTPKERKQNGEEWFDSALAFLDQPTIPVLRVRDENTTGLRGDESDPMSPWFRLVKKQGSAAMHGAGGGTYGIGQRAPFSRSGLRTVLYSTRTNGAVSLIGKAILSSFHDEAGGVCSRIGYWGRVEGTDLQRKAKAIIEASEIPPIFLREEPGTDLFILGYQKTPGWDASILESLAINFFSALQAGKLVAKVEEPGAGESTVLQQEGLAEEIEKLYKSAMSRATSNTAKQDVDSTLGATRFFLRALLGPVGPATSFEKESVKLGKLCLRVHQEEKAPATVAFMRRPRILVYTRSMKVIPNYAAVFLAEDEKGNEALAQLEDPAHLKWDRERKGGEALLHEIYEFARESLKKLAAQDPDVPEDIPELARYLADDGLGPIPPKKGMAKPSKLIVPEETGRRQQRQGKVNAVVRPKPPPPPTTGEVDDGDAGDDQGLEVLGSGVGTGTAPNATEEGGIGTGTTGGGTGAVDGTGTAGTGAGPGPGTGEGNLGGSTGTGQQFEVEGTGTGTGPPPVPGKSGGILRVLAAHQLRCRSYFDTSHVAQHIVLTASKDGKASLRLSELGETGDYETKIVSAVDLTTGEAVPISGGDTLTDLVFIAGQRRELAVKLESGRPLALGIEVLHGS